jgi:hypothetical protein
MAMPGLLPNMFGGAFTVFFDLYAKPWKARDLKSRRHIGIGAFNSIRAEVTYTPAICDIFRIARNDPISFAG